MIPLDSTEILIHIRSHIHSMNEGVLRSYYALGIYAKHRGCNDNQIIATSASAEVTLGWCRYFSV